jgi:hypothetical protein
MRAATGTKSKSLAALLALAGALSPAAAGAKGEWQLARHGTAPGQGYGFSVADAGDFDGDGYRDLIVGALYDDTRAAAAGRAEILFGGPDPSARVPLSLFGDAAADDQFGVSVAGGGDLNGDGYADVAVASRFNDRGGNDAGAVFVFFGGPSADATADLVLAGTIADDWFGNSVAIVQDVDGDGDDELLVGAPYNDDLGAAAGRAALYRGGPGLDATPDVVCHGDAQSNAHFGWTVASAGDVNGDGHGDWVVGARLYGSGITRARGRAYVFLGGPGADGIADRVYTGERKDDWFGQEVAGVGDVNGDGFDEVAVGAVYWDGPSAASAGRAYLFAGGIEAVPTPLATVEGTAANGQMGFSLAGPLDSPWPGAAWAAGAPVADAGEVRIVAFDPSGMSRTLLRSVGDQAGDRWGYDLAAVEGHLGNGVRLYAASALYRDAGAPDAGSVERAVRACLVLTFGTKSRVDVARCAPYPSLGLLEGDLSGGAATLFCAAVGAEPSFSVLDDPSPGDVLALLVVGAEAAAGYDSGGSPHEAGGSCP